MTLQFDWRKRGEDMQKLHPTGTPSAVAAAVEKVRESTYQEVPNVALPTPEETLAFLGKSIAGLADASRREYFHQAQNHTGLVIRHPKVLVKTLVNPTSAALLVALTNHDGAAATTQGISIPAFSAVTKLDLLYVGALWIASLYTTSGNANQATVTVGGTAANAQVYSFTINITGVGPVTVSYTATGTDTNVTIAAALAAAVNSSAASSYIQANNVGANVTLLCTLPGSQTSSYTIGAVSASGTGTLTPSTFSGATAPLVEIAGEYV